MWCCRKFIVNRLDQRGERLFLTTSRCGEKTRQEGTFFNQSNQIKNLSSQILQGQLLIYGLPSIRAHHRISPTPKKKWATEIKKKKINALIVAVSSHQPLTRRGVAPHAGLRDSVQGFEFAWLSVYSWYLSRASLRSSLFSSLLV